MSVITNNGISISRYGFYPPYDGWRISTWGFSYGLPLPQPIPWSIDAHIKLLLDQFRKESTNLINLLKILITPLYEVELVLLSLKDSRNLDTITSKLLDCAGAIVGVSRGVLSDEDYRLLIKLYIYLQTSSGEPEVIISALRLFTKATSIHYKEVYPAKILLEFTSPYTPPSNLRELLQKLALGGVKIMLSWAIDTSANFGFAGEGVLSESPDVKGFGENDFPNEGGKFIEKL